MFFAAMRRWVTRDDGAKELQAECSHLGHVMALYLAARCAMMHLLSL
jgi:hypothetical protein